MTLRKMPMRRAGVCRNSSSLTGVISVIFPSAGASRMFGSVGMCLFGSLKKARVARRGMAAAIWGQGRAFCQRNHDIRARASKRVVMKSISRRP